MPEKAVGENQGNHTWFYRVAQSSGSPIIVLGMSLEKSLMLGKTEGRRRRGHQRMRWLDGITDAMDMNLGKLRKMVRDRKSTESQRVGQTRQLNNQQQQRCPGSRPIGLAGGAKQAQGQRAEGRRRIPRKEAPPATPGMELHPHMEGSAGVLQP